MEEYIIWRLIEENKNFLLSGGAGSGKTYTLVQVLRMISHTYPNKTIACITYTNTAVNEIKSRIDNKNLHVSTIHDFLWSCICNYQTELKETFKDLFQLEDFDIKEDIQYKEYTRLKEGIISHDEVLSLAEKMYSKYPKLVKILINSYPFIMVDEYQDTNKSVVDILLRHLNKKETDSRFVVGFFGDSMQSIYDGVGNLNEYIKDGLVTEVQKTDNRRNPQFVINLANKLRTDNLIQKASNDKLAPNIDKNTGYVKHGCAVFLYSSNPDLDNVRRYLITQSDFLWDEKKIKELHLTKKLIAGKAGFPTLYNIYSGDDEVYKVVHKLKKYFKNHSLKIDDNRNIDSLMQEYGKSANVDMSVNIKPISKMQWGTLENMYVNIDMLMDNKTIEEDEQNSTESTLSKLVDYILKIMQLIDMYQNNNVGDFLKKTEYKITTFLDKKRLSESMNSLSFNDVNIKIGDVISLCENLNLIKQSDGLIYEIQSNVYIYNLVCSVPFTELVKLYEYKERYSPYATQHGVKGAEFDYVLVNLDNGRWTNYNFKTLFKDGSSKESVISRTLNLFYVCCTRAKEGLAVFIHNPSETVIAEAQKMFGNENVINID